MAPAGLSGPPADDRRDQWFPVALTGGDGTAGYTGYEVWLDPDHAAVEVVGGRVLTTTQPGFPLDGTTFDTAADPPPLALARIGPGAGGRLWELAAFGASVTASGTGCTPPGIDSAECLEFVVSAGAGRCANIDAVAAITATLTGGWWTADDTFTTAAGAGTVKYRINSTGYPEMKVTVGVTDYYGTPAGCDASGRPRFAFGGSALCDAPAETETCDNLFYVAVGCVPCGITTDECTGWYCDDETGTTYYVADCDALAELITSLGGGGSPVTTSCGRVVPNRLYLVFDGVLSGLGVVALQHSTGDLWSQIGVPDSLACNSNPAWDFEYDACTRKLYARSWSGGLGCQINQVGPFEYLTQITTSPFKDEGYVTVVPGLGCSCTGTVLATVYGA